MSKKKNTLKDLDEFLKQQAATLVSPDKLTDKKEDSTQVQEAAAMKRLAAEISHEKILEDLQELSRREGEQFPNRFYDLIIRSFESRNKLTAEEKMLINTALYLKSGHQWKQVIREYWSKRI
jgi:hypothetical protein